MREHYAGSRTSPGDVLEIAGSVQDDPERKHRSRLPVRQPAPALVLSILFLSSRSYKQGV